MLLSTPLILCPLSLSLDWPCQHVIPLSTPQSTAAAAEHRLQVAESETQRLTAELAHARKNEAHAAAEHEHKLKALEAQLKAVENKLADEHRHFTAHEAEMHATIASLNDTLVQATAQSGSTHDALEASEHRIAALTAELDAARQLAAQAAFEAKNHLQATVDAGAQREAALNATIAELQQSLGQAAGDFATTQADAEATAATLAATAAELAKQKQELADVIRVHTARGDNEIAQAAPVAGAPPLSRRVSAAPVSGPPPTPSARMAALGLARMSVTSLGRIASRERKTMKAFMDSFPTRAGVLNKKRPDSFFSKDAQTRYFELVGNKLMYYKDQSKVEFKGDISLDAFQPIDIERATMLAAENMSEFSIILEPIDKSQNKPAEFVPTELTPEGVADVLEWAATINTRILLTRYLEGAFKEDGFFRGVHEIVDFMADDKMSDFTMVDRAASTELHDALTTFLPSLIARQDLSLTLMNVGIGHPTVLLLNQVLTRSTSFRSLNLAHNNLQSDSAIVLAKSFARNSSLTSLDLDGNAIGDDGVAALAGAFANQPMLKRLSLRANFIGDAGAVALVDGLRASAARQQCAHEFPVVELSGNRVGDRGAAALAELIAENSTVTEVNLRGNLLTDAGVAPLVSAVRGGAGGSARVARLDLSANNLSSASLQLIADMLRATQHAISINVSENLIGRIGVEALGAVDQPLEFRQLHVLRK